MRELLTLPVLAVVLFAQAPPQLVVSVGHLGGPSLATFAGAYLATASWSNVALIDLASGLTVAHLPHPNLVQSIEANPAGDLLAVGTCDHSIQLWDLKSRRLLRRIPLVQECAESVSFSPDGAFLATGAYACCSGSLQIWSVHNGTLARELAKGSGIRKVVFSREGRWLAGVDDKGKASVFEWPSGRQLQSYEGLDGSGGSESAALASSDGRYLAWLGKHSIQVWDVKTGERIQLPGARTITVRDIPPDGPERQWTEERVPASAAQFLNDGRLAYVDDDRALLMTLPNGPTQELALEPPTTEWFGHVGLTMAPSWLAIRRDGRMLAGAYDSRTVLWDVASGKLRDLKTPALTDAGSLQWSRSGVIAWADLGSGIRAWNDRYGEPVDLTDTAVESAEALDFQRDGERLAVSDSFSIHIVDLRRRRAVASLKLPPALRTGVAFSPDGSTLAFAASEGLAVFDGRLRQRTHLAKLEEYTSAEHVAFSPDGRWIAAGLGGPQPAVRVWPSDGSGNAVTLDTNRLTYGPQPPVFSADSRWLASFSKGESLMLWSTGSWKLERTWKLPGTGRSLAFAPQGPRLAFAGDGGASIWDANTGEKLVTFTTEGSSQARQIAWSPDGTRIVTAADDGVLRFWNAADGRLLASLFTLASSRDWLLVSADGRVDGTERALADLVAWRIGDRVALDKSLTARHRVRRLWRSLSSTSSGR